MADAVDVAIISAGHDVADARIHKIASALIRRDLTVELFGLGQEVDAPAGVIVHVAQRGSMVRRAARALRLPWRTSARVLFTVDPEVVISARLAGWLRGRAVVADVHEDYVKLLNDRAWARGTAGRVGRLVAGAAVKSSARADLTVVTDEWIPPQEARHRLVVRNLPDPSLLPPPSESGGGRRAVYVGDLRRSRGLFDMVDSIAGAPGWELDLVGPVASSDEDELRKRVSESDVAGRVRLHGRMPPAAAWQVARGASVGLLLLHDTPAFRHAMPTKLYEYLAGGLAVITTPLPRQAAVVEESGGGVVVEASEVAATLQRWADDPRQLARHRVAALEWAGRNLGDDDPYGGLAIAVAELAARRR